MAVLSPLPGLRGSHFHIPRLTLWAAFFRRFAAEGVARSVWLRSIGLIVKERHYLADNALLDIIAIEAWGQGKNRSTGGKVPG
jgi:hypothetical protein